MKMRKILIITTSIIILLLFVLVASISYNTGKNYGVANAEAIRVAKTKSEKIHQKKVKSVLVTKVKNTNNKSIISSSGRVVSLNNTTILSEVQGRLIGNNTFKKGAKYKKGELIFSVKDTDLKLLINSKKSRFMGTISMILSDIKLDFRKEYNKWEFFFNSIDLDNSLPKLPKMNSIKEKNYIISRGIITEYLSIRSDEERLSKYTVLAPFNGTVTKSYTDVGGNVNPGSPVIDFIRNGEMEIELTVNPSEIDLINIGDSVSFINNKEYYTGVINRKSEFVNINTQNISVFAIITDNSTKLYNGTYLKATIITKGIDNTFKLPRRSIFNKNKVYVVTSENKLKKKTVNIISYQENTVIIDNLKDNMLIVNEPLVNSNEGEFVKSIIN